MDDDVPSLKPPLHNSSAPRDLEPNSSDVESLRKWQEDRLTRKLRGEYESAVLRLGELINDNLATPMRVASVRVEGAPNTRRSFLDWLLKPQLTASPSPDASTLRSVLRDTSAITHILRETDIFSEIEPKLEVSRDLLAKDGDVDVVFRTKEKGRGFLKTATTFGDGEGSASVQARARNLFGGAETLDATIALGTRTRRAFNLSLSAPLTPDLKTRGEVLAYGLERDCTTFASCVEEARGLKASIRRLTGASVHEFSYEAVMRRVGSLTPGVSLSMRHAAGASLKSALSHTWTHDTRDDKITATRGAYFKTIQELAGLGGDTFFFKSQGNIQVSRPFLHGSSISLAARGGVLWPLTPRPALFSDRFQLGGPLDVRMLRQNGLGPMDAADSLGGNVYWAAGLSILSDLPRKPHWPIKLHTFVNSGQLDVVDKSKSLSDNIASWTSRPSVSTGVGLIYRFDPVRVELNFGVPLVASKSDVSRRGFQLGMGLEFL